MPTSATQTSSSMSSTTSASTVPSVDITSDSSRTSSSSSICRVPLPPCCSPSASISIAARFRAGDLLPRPANLPRPRVASTLLMSVEFCACDMAISRSLGGFAQAPTIMAAVPEDFVPASSPTRCTDWAWTCRCTWATSVRFGAELANEDCLAAHRLHSFDRRRFRSCTGQGCHLLGSKDALDQRSHHHEHHHEAEQHRGAQAR